MVPPLKVPRLRGALAGGTVRTGWCVVESAGLEDVSGVTVDLCPHAESLSGG